MSTDIRAIVVEAFKAVLKKSPYGVTLGVGNFLTFDIGEKMQYKLKTKNGDKDCERGEYCLWFYGCEWRIDKGNVPIVASQDDRTTIAEKIEVLKDKKINGVSLAEGSCDLEISFEDGLMIKTFLAISEKEEQWMFFLPDRRVFSASASTIFQSQ